MQAKHKKIYGAVLGLAAAAFAVDRWVIGTDSADAEQVDAEAAEVAAAAPASDAAPAQPPVAAPGSDQIAAAGSSPASSLADRLGTVAEAHRIHGENLAEVRDAFRASDVWLADLAPKPAAAKAASEPVAVPRPLAPRRDLVAEFKKAHALNAVMRDARGGLAIVDGKTVRPGQTVGGFRLVRVSDGAAVFQLNGLRAELRLPNPDKLK